MRRGETRIDRDERFETIQRGEMVTDHLVTMMTSLVEELFKVLTNQINLELIF